MGCGCGKKRAAQIAARSTPTVPATKVVYDVMDGNGSLVASHSNPVIARSEARRSKGTVVPRNEKG